MATFIYEIARGRPSKTGGICFRNEKGSTEKSEHKKNKDFLGNVTIYFHARKVGGNPVSGGTRGGKKGRERGAGKPKPLKKKERKEKKKKKKLARLEKRMLR